MRGIWEKPPVIPLPEQREGGRAEAPHFSRQRRNGKHNIPPRRAERMFPNHPEGRGKISIRGV